MKERIAEIRAKQEENIKEWLKTIAGVVLGAAMIIVAGV